MYWINTIKAKCICLNGYSGNYCELYIDPVIQTTTTTTTTTSTAQPIIDIDICQFMNCQNSNLLNI